MRNASCTPTPAGCAVAAQRDGLLPLNQMSMEFYDRVGYHEYEGVALNLDEQKRLVDDRQPSGVDPAQPRSADGGRERGPGIPAHVPPGEGLRDPGHRPAGGGPLTLPSAETCEYTARQLAGDADADLQDDVAYDLAWAAMLRLLNRVAPDYRD